MILIKRYRVSMKGIRGLVITIPKLWADTVGVKPGTSLEIYQDEEDRLIILPPENIVEKSTGKRL